MSSIQVTVAAYHNEPALKSAAKVLVSKDNLLQLTGALENGRLCIVESSAGVSREALLWVAPDNLKKTLVRVSKALLEVLEMRVGDKCSISVPSGAPTALAASEILVEDTASTPRNISWHHALMDPLDLAEYVFPGMVLKDVYHRRERRSFRVLEVDGRADNIARFVMDQTHVVLSETSSTAEERPSTPHQPSTPRTPKPSLTATLPFRSAAAAASTASPTASPSRTLKSRLAAQPATAPGSPAPKPAASSPRPPPTSIEIGQIDGLETAVMDEINIFLEHFNPDSEPLGFGLSCGAAIQGDKGTGKTLLLERITKTGWGKVFPIRPTDKLAAIQETLQKASEERPSIVTIEDIHELLPEDRTNRVSVIRTIADFLDANVDSRGANESEEISTELISTGRPASQVPQIMVLVTCLDYLKDIPEALREPGRLDWLVQLPFPDPSGRRAILRSFGLPFPPDQVDAMILALSHQTHAFSGKDLRKLCNTALRIRRTRLKKLKAAKVANEANGDVAVDKQQEVYLTEADFKEARRRVGPSRMDGVDVKPRPVYWRDIHGQEDLVRAFKQRVDMMNRPEKYTRWISPFPRGFLLYGPPGCSKTMAAQALATESELNYFSVKGGELLNQYVGETERGIRDLFAKARRASPAVIFLDEIDALGGRRADFGDGSASSARGPQMVPALLTELDGFEPLDKVLIVAATNRPEALDPALLRSGRIDKHFYVPPPDESARRAIFASWTKGMDVSPDLDLDLLARESVQLSGADIMGVCQKAGESVCNEESDDDVPKQLMTRHFLAAIKRAPRTITPQMLQHFQKWSPA